MWTTYHSKTAQTWRCRLFGHKSPQDAPDPPNGHSPSNYSRCGRRRCRAHLKWIPSAS